jgi:hypothetical protein
VEQRRRLTTLKGQTCAACAVASSADSARCCHADAKPAFCRVSTAQIQIFTLTCDSLAWTIEFGWHLFHRVASPIGIALRGEYFFYHGIHVKDDANAQSARALITHPKYLPINISQISCLFLFLFWKPVQAPQNASPGKLAIAWRLRSSNAQEDWFFTDHKLERARSRYCCQNFQVLVSIETSDDADVFKSLLLYFSSPIQSSDYELRCYKEWTHMSIPIIRVRHGNMKLLTSL